MTRTRKAWLLLLLLAPAVAAFGIKIRLANNPGPDWDLAFVVTDLTGGPGSDFATDIESADPAMTMNITQTSSNWTVDVSRTDTLPAGVVVEVRRTSDGDDGNYITGGTSYQVISSTAAELFRGTSRARKVDFQFRTNGGLASLGVPAGIHTTTVTYTVTDNAW